ncbi:GMC family oxidoreductase [Paenibacillus sp. H1-7]|uniref:GMC oxidoreductase n=1 Tax=Paenibacillus sp. H1-7 TaxID=2282849 RepID=UPI001EF970F9|nr:GMC family oxidoreductase [Paenibacillus sp. H1-7]
MNIRFHARKDRPINEASAVDGKLPVYCPLPGPDYLKYWIPTVSLEQMAATQYDALVIGSGAGGGAALWRLCERWRQEGKRIGMIEAGEPVIPTHVQNISTMNEELAEAYLLNPRVSEPLGEVLPEFRGFRRFRLLGGRTIFWGAVTPRRRGFELEGWPVTESELEPYYNIAEQFMRVTRQFSGESPYTRILLERLREQGYPDAEAYPIAADLESTTFGVIHSNVFFSSIQFLAAARHARPFDLAVNARAVRLFTEDGRVTGVKVMSKDKKSYTVRSPIIILSASTLETPRILLNSGIGGTSVGHYLTNHTIVTTQASISRKQFPEMLGGLGILIPSTAERHFQIQISGNFWTQSLNGPLQEKLLFDLSGFGEVESRYVNRVELDPLKTDAYGVPEIRVRFSYSDKDRLVITRMAEELMKSMAALGAAPVPRDGEPDLCLRLPGRPYHECGTCRMGTDPAYSVTNAHGQVHGVTGLYVADNSVLPTSGAANPTLTTAALAIRTADAIAGGLL